MGLIQVGTVLSLIGLWVRLAFHLLLTSTTGLINRMSLKKTAVGVGTVSLCELHARLSQTLGGVYH